MLRYRVVGGKDDVRGLSCTCVCVCVCVFVCVCVCGLVR
jgi:hypothetical protein